MASPVNAGGINQRPGRYVYRQLGSREIRVLTPVPSSGALKWRCRHQDVESEESFCAISYVWGEDTRSIQTSIYIDDHPVDVGPNALSCLETYAALDTALPVWIDALCIDQQNSDEKLQQIPLMGEVYSLAERVLVHLGESYRIFKKESEPDLDITAVMSALEKLKISHDRSHVHFNRAIPIALTRNQYALCDLMTKPWWARVWTMQEYVLAREVAFVYGNAIIEGSVLLRFFELYKLLNLAELESLMDPDRFMFQVAGSGSKEVFQPSDARISLAELQLMRSQLLARTANDDARLRADLVVLTSSFRRQATVPSDHILGLMGMLQSIVLASVQTRLRSTKQDIFTSVARAVLTNPARHESFALLHYTDTVLKLEQMPSWTPNFSSRLCAVPLSPWTATGDFLYNAGGGLPELEVLHRDIIKLHAKVLGVVEKTTNVDTSAWEHVVPPGMHYSCAAQLEFQTSAREVAASAFALNRDGQANTSNAVATYCATLVAGSRRQGTSYVRWSPSMEVYRDCVKRMMKLSDPRHDWLHETRNPGSKVDLGFIYGKSKDSTVVFETGGEAEEFHQRFYEVCQGRLLFSTASGMIGLGPLRTQKGDLVVVVQGARTPLILRPVGTHGEEQLRYQLIGESYLHGSMDGEAFDNSHVAYVPESRSILLE